MKNFEKIEEKIRHLYKKKPNMFKFAAVVVVMLVAGYFFGE